MTDWTSELETRSKPYCEPCSAAAPAGADVRYDPQFEALQQEVAKLETPQSGPPSWAVIEKESAALLRTKSKDVLVACWLSAALHERHGLDGLATGLWALGSIVDGYWDGLFPPVARMKARVSAVIWLVERTATKLDTHEGTLDHDTVDRLGFAVKRLQRVMPERYGQHAPGTRPLADRVERLRLSLPPRAEPAASAPAAPSAPAPAAATPSAPAPAPAAANAPSAPAAAPEEDHAAQLEKRAAPYLAPIPGAQPAGEDLRYDNQHEALRNEVAKLENPGAGAPDWKLVVKGGTELLEKRSKDVLIASYVAWGLYERDGLDGLATGLIMVGGMVGGFWEGLHPSRVRARSNALSWLLARIDIVFNAPTPPRGAADRETLERLELAARAFSAIVRDKLAEEAPGLRPLMAHVERTKMSLPAPAPPAPPAPAVAPAPTATPAPAPVAAPAPAAPAPAAPAPAAPAAAAVPALAAGGDVTPFLQQSGASLVAAAKMLRAASASDATPYRLLRTGLYLAIVAAPPVSAAPKTNVPPPPANLRTQLQTLHSNAKWAALLDEAEGAVASYRFWLDLQRYVVAALGGLGHADAAAAVTVEAAHLVRRLPALLERQFADAFPFASPETVAWIGTISGSPGGGGATAGADEADPVEDAIRAARSLAGGGKRDEALRSLQTAVRTAADERARFRLRLALARVCAQGAVPAARGIYEGLTRDIEAMRVDQWDPALAAESLRAHYELLRDAAKTNPRVAEEAADVYRRLCRIDALVAIAAGG